MTSIKNFSCIYFERKKYFTVSYFNCCGIFCTH